MKWIRTLQVLGLVLAAAIIPACLSSNPDRSAPQPPALTEGLTFKAARLSGRQEVPAVVTTGTGNATVVIDPNYRSLTVTVEVSGLADMTAAHLHFGGPGVDGPILFPLATSSFASPLTVTLTSGNFTPNPSITTFEQALAMIQSGNTYVNVRTTAFPDGEIRGQVGPVVLLASLTGAEEVPTALTFASGAFDVTFNNDQTSMFITLTQAGLGVPVTAAHIHIGPPGAEGPIIFPLAETFSDVPLNLTLTAADLTAQTGATTFEEAIDALLGGATYVNLHTQNFPDGEIRGQILPPALVAVEPPPPIITSPPPIIITPY